ncbi:MAG: hypothetical protein LBK42_09215, partial [Propionibacteriaceae bacterium]|nr:hypothetical protein [Propionibacteriaceae bacterium]
AWAAAAVHELRGDARVARVAEAARHAHTGLDLAQVLGAAAVGEDEAKRFLADWRGADEPDATDLADLPVQPVIGFDYPGYGVAVNLLPGEDPDPDIMARLAQLRAILDQAALDYQAANG